MSSTQHPQAPNCKRPRIKWAWLTLSCVSLCAGFLHLAMVDMTGAVQLSQQPTEQQLTEQQP
ncbi:hypothetical protein N836_04735 [Leptolyngbya sp. Heron Island J]|uniref:hypothetical protein n=1 Tax=Leptolyngbya sp. Heron Island J TaxID=1385935 RepID=UPI0003B97239|nr:hypothetical protein [Leptolyngbya sp. Heron Island J]ESA36868.1 hypothetical protein N836_04735 [Leptolyngbya sp. Heron Island J]